MSSVDDSGVQVSIPASAAATSSTSSATTGIASLEVTQSEDTEVTPDVASTHRVREYYNAAVEIGSNVPYVRLFRYRTHLESIYYQRFYGNHGVLHVSE